MIAFLHGIVRQLTRDTLLLDVHGVGYRIAISEWAFAKFQGKEDLEVRTYLHVREEELSLFGFAADMEEEVFHWLTTVSGIGPRLALAILGYFGPEATMQHLASGNVAALTKVSGVGKKTSERMILELQDKVKKRIGDLSVANAGQSGNRAVAADELTLALEALGFSSSEIATVHEHIPNGLPLEVSIKEALRHSSTTRIER